MLFTRVVVKLGDWETCTRYLVASGTEPQLNCGLPGTNPPLGLNPLGATVGTTAAAGDSPNGVTETAITVPASSAMKRARIARTTTPPDGPRRPPSLGP